MFQGAGIGIDLWQRAETPAAAAARVGHEEKTSGAARAVSSTLLCKVKASKAVKEPEPECSDEVRKKKIRATVILLLIVDTQRRVTNLHVVRPAGYGLDEAALRAVQDWQFKPATSNGVPVPVAINVEVNFRLY